MFRWPWRRAARQAPTEKAPAPRRHVDRAAQGGSREPEPEADEDAPIPEYTCLHGYHLANLPESVARLQRFRELQAPELFIENELLLIQRKIAALPPEEALAAILGWRALAPYSHPGFWRDSRLVGWLLDPDFEYAGAPAGRKPTPGRS